MQVHARAHSLSIHSVWGGARLQVLNVASRRTRTRKVIRIWRRFRKAPSTLCICACLPNSPYAHAYIAHICIYMHIIFILHILSCSRSKRNQRSTGLKSRRSGTAVERSVVGLDSDDESDGTSTLPESRTNKNGLKLTKSGRPSIKKNGVNARYSTKYRSPSKQRKLLGKSLSMSKACAIIGTVMFGPEILLEDAGHDDRLRVLKQRRSIASTTKISQISSTQRSPR